MAYKQTLIRQFKGLSQTLALTSGSPEYAVNCVNVIPSTAGLAKLRVPPALSAPIAGITTGPDQFAMFSGSSKQVMNFFGQFIYIASLDDFGMTLFDGNPDYNGIVPWSVVMSNDFAFMQNGTSNPLKYTGTFPLEKWGIQQANLPSLGFPFGFGGYTVVTGRRYRVAYKNSVTGHVGTASVPSANTGPISNQTVPINIPGPQAGFEDAQIDAVRIYSTLDGGGDYFFNAEIPVTTFPVVFNDATLDVDLDQSERAPLINMLPPRAKYMCAWGARIFMFNLIDESPKWVAYTGYNRIFVGRPEEACPPLNRLKIDTGADEISGGGVIEAGVIVFDNSNKMFMFRGSPEDITVEAPVEYSLILKQLPFTIGCASHFTIQSCPYGLVWLSPCYDVYLYNGEGHPRSLTTGCEPIMRSINPARIADSRAVYWQYKGRDWYVLGIPTNGSNELNTILIFDMDPNEEVNRGTFPLDIGAFQSLGIVEMQDGQEKLVIGQGGQLKELTITATTQNGIEVNIQSTTATLGAFYQGGFIGNEQPEVESFVRWARVTSDNTGIRVKIRLVRDEVTNPQIVEFQDLQPGGKFSINKKARLWSYEYRFNDLDVPQNILQVVDMSIPVAER